MNNLELINKENNPLNKPAIILRDLWRALESGETYVRWSSRQLEDFLQGVDFIGVGINVNPTNGVIINDHAVTIEVAKHIALMSRTENGKRYRQKLIELEESNNIQKLPKTHIEAVRAYLGELEAHEETKQVLLETQIVLEDKKVKLDESMNYLSIKRVAQFNNIPWRSISWRKLKATGYEIKSIFDANYGNVNAYSRDAWLEVYPDLALPTEQSM